MVVVAGDGVVAEHERVVSEGRTRNDWQQHVPLVQLKPGAMHNGAPLADPPEPLQRLRRGLLREGGGDRVSREHVLKVIGRLSSAPALENATTSLQASTSPLADAARYGTWRAHDDAVDNAPEIEHA